MKSNMRRAFVAFDDGLQDRLETEKKRSCFRAILFGLCFYHSLLLGRKKFGVGIGTGAGSGLGFCRGYSFNLGDLTTCGDVLINYLNSYEEVPWADLRYMFGEVFYGGHITDNMDRRCCTTYLDVLIKPELLPAGDIYDPGSWAQPTIMLSPDFHPPIPTTFEAIAHYIEHNLPSESPVVYGMHTNAELSLLTAEGETLFKTIFNVSGGGAGGAGSSGEDRVRTELEQFMATLPDQFDIFDIESRVEDKTPYVVVALQEAARMNSLLVEMKRSMDELLLGLDGSLNMSAAMEALAAGIRSNSVPARWMAQMSTRIQEVYSLSAWFNDVLSRHAQLDAWTQGSVVTPLCVWLPGLFNPKAFVTAVMQTYARKHQLPLDVMRFMTDVTAMSPETVTEDGGESKYIHGLYLEGARWDAEAGSLADSVPNELHQPLPVVRIRPVHSDDYNLDGYCLLALDPFSLVWLAQLCMRPVLQQQLLQPMRCPGLCPTAPCIDTWCLSAQVLPLSGVCQHATSQCLLPYCGHADAEKPGACLEMGACIRFCPAAR
jgi:dynein heavy chain, axonemal